MVRSMSASPTSMARGGSFRLDFTPLGKRAALVFGGLWLLGWLIALLPPDLVPVLYPQSGGIRYPLAEWLVLHPPGGGPPMGVGFRPWQLLTGPLLFAPSAFGSYVLSAFGLGFFGHTVERFLGRRRFIELCIAAVVGSLAGAALFGWIQQPPVVHSGLWPVVLALVVVNCSLTPEASVNFFMVLPVKLRWIAMGVAFLVIGKTLGMFVPFGAAPSPGGYELGGMVIGWLFWRYRDRLDPRAIRRRRKARTLLRAVEDTVSSDDGPMWN